MYNVTNGWWWWNPTCWGHDFFTAIDTSCAWSEGWGHFFALVVNGDSCYDWGIGPCAGTADRDHFNLEAHSRNDNPQQFPWGDTVEGRVAGALYDIFDSTNEPQFDSATFPFWPIWNVMRVGPAENNLAEFWNTWKANGNNKHHPVRAIYQNTIDYDAAPRFDPPLPNLDAPMNTVWNHALDLWNYSQDAESADSELAWQIQSVTDTRCGVSLDSHYVNIVPQRGWLGVCDVTVVVNDTIKTGSDTFRVNVVPPRVFLPLILKQH